MHSTNALLMALLSLGSLSADADPVLGALLHVPRKWIAKKIYFMNGAALAQSDTDLFVISLKDKDGNVIASFNTADTDGDGPIVKDTPVEMVLNTSHAGYNTEQLAVAVEAGLCTVEYDETDSGTAVALTSAQIQVYGEWKQTESFEALA